MSFYGNLEEERFLKGLVSSLLLEGCEFINTCNSEYHLRFRRVAEKVIKDNDVRRNFPLAIYPNMFGHYSVWTEALVCSVGMTKLYPYTGVALDMSRERAQNMLSLYISETEKKKTLRSLAQLYLVPLNEEERRELSRAV